MCGIAGIINIDGAPVDSVELDRLTDALEHRGPDGRGTMIKGNVGFGHRRLSILDLSEAAAQPMLSEDGAIALTYNGEIYNFRELRAELETRGHVFHSTGDTEVLLRAYIEYGEACVQRLQGMFAFAILDLRKKKIFLARDRLGKKPLKYFFQGKTFAFASELKALRTLPSCPHDMNGEAVHHFLTMMYVPSPETGITGIKKLPAAHTMTIDLTTGTHAIQRYWQPEYRADSTKSLEEWERQTWSLFDDAVRVRMVSDVPIGAFLSGGIDSAAVVVAMSKHSPKPVRTFSIGTSEPTHNELPYAAMLAERYGTEHHPIVVEPDIVRLLPELVRAYEEPFADPSSIPTYLLAQETRRFVTVALNGDGGDENFAGYARYPILRFSRALHRLPVAANAAFLAGAKLFHALAGNTLSYRSVRFQSTVRCSEAERHLEYLSFFTETEKRSLYRPGFAGAFQPTAAWYAVHCRQASERSDNWLHQAMSRDIDTYLADDLLPKVDIGSMAHGLEARSPFLDHTFMEFVATMPQEYKLHGRKKKWILREILRDRIPEAILRKPKTGFRLPLDQWFRTSLKTFVDDRLLDPSSSLRTLFEPSMIETFLREYRASSIDMSDHVWALLWLDEWMAQYTAAA